MSLSGIYFFCVVCALGLGIYFLGLDGWFFVPEIISITLALIFILNKFKRGGTTVFIFFSLIISVIYGIQFYSVYKTGGYISSLAMANAEAGFSTNVNHFGFWIFSIFFLTWFLFFLKSNRINLNISSLFVIPLVVCIFLSYKNGVKSNNISLNGFQSPIFSFANSYFDLNEKIEILGINDINSGLNYFKKEYVYSNDVRDVSYIDSDKNIIILFVEGMSSRWLGKGEIFGYDLMPNMRGVQHESLYFSNYWNHTAATFRGLRGQIQSSFQQIGGGDLLNYEGFGKSGSGSYFNPLGKKGLHDVLRKYGYQSYFFVSQENYLNSMLNTMGFDEVYGRDKLYGKWGIGEPPVVLSDQDFFDFTLKTLNEKEGKFISFLYNFDTHNGLDGSIKYRDGNNEVLNRFHTFDVVFGDFIEKFKKSKLFENTVLVITSDHATFPDLKARAADSTIHSDFVDQIPFIIYSKESKNMEFNSKGQTSIGFAPTILNLLGINKAENYFFGCSLLDFCKKNHFSNIDDAIYKMNESGYVYINPNDINNSENDQVIINDILKYKKINNFHKF